MTESLLHYLWKFRLFNQTRLNTKSDETVEIIHPGIHNHNSGPDFFNAKIKIGNKTWAGNVEIHFNGNEWYLHKHQFDAAYKNVVLHVVFQADNLYYECLENKTIPCLELKGRVDENLLSRYNFLMQNELPFPCAASLKNIEEFIQHNMLERAAVERLENKTKHIEDQLKATNGDWEQTCWQTVARYLGSGIHGDALELVARNIPITTIAKHSNNSLQIEAIVFGVAGMLNEVFADDYPNELKREFNYLKRLHSLPEMNKGIFKWAKTRPANFPTLRLAQLAALAQNMQHIFSKLLKDDIQFLAGLLNKLEVNIYWKNHFRFDEEAENKFSSIGKNTLQIITINAIVPLLFAYGKNTGNEMLTEKAVDILRQSKPEINATISLFKKYGMAAPNALLTQGVLQLKNSYCNNKQCLNCSIGNSILKN